MAKVLKTAALVIGGAALIATGIGAVAGVALGFGAAAGVGAVFAGIGISAGTAFAIAAGLSLGASLLSPKPKVPDTSPSTTDRLSASIVLRAPRTFVFGHTAMATDIRDQELSSDQAYLHRFIVCASHKVQSIEELWLDDKQAWTSAGGVTSAFSGYLTVTTVLEGSAANAINIGARMGSARRYTGCAYLYVKFRLTGTSSKVQSPFASSVPTRTTIIGKSAWVYDPRLDSTAGGSGSQRAGDQTTWAWDDSASRNPALQMLTYLLGWRIQNPSTSAWKLAVGKGIPPARIDLASFITAANFCDEAVAKAAGGTEPRYRSDGIFSENDALETVLDNFKAAMNAVLDDADGKIRITVLHNDLASPIGSLSTGDVVGEFTWTQAPPLSDSFNVVRGGYTDPSTTSLYQLVDYPEVSIASPDGIERVSTVNLPLVQSPSQAQRLAKMRLQRALYGGTFAATFLSTAWKYQKGDCIQFTFSPLGWANKLFRIADIAAGVDGLVTMTLREEAAAIYAWDASDAAAVTGVAPTAYDPTLSPVVQAIGAAETKLVTVATGATRNEAGGNLLPAPADPTTWTLGNGAIVAYPTAGRARMQFYTTNAYGYWGPPVRCRAGIPLYAHCSLASDNASADTTNVSVLWTDSTGATTVQNLSDRSSRTLSDATTEIGVDFSVIPPVNGTAQFYSERHVAGGYSMYVDNFYVGESQYAADVTALAQVTLVGPDTVRVAADSMGGPLADTTIGYKLVVGGVDRSADATWSIPSSASCSVSVSGGVVTRTGALGASGRFTVRAAFGGVNYDAPVSFIRDDAAPPTSTGGGSGGGNPGTNGHADVSSSTTSNAPGSAGAESAFTCVAGSGGQVALAINLDYSVSRTSGASVSESGAAKLQWRAVGGTWADVSGGSGGTDVNATWSRTDGSTSGTIALAATKTGLTSGTTYEFRCLFWRGGSTSGVTATGYGTLTGAGS